jgi:DNA-binding transcriptional MocR family regulator
VIGSIRDLPPVLKKSEVNFRWYQHLDFRDSARGAVDLDRFYSILENELRTAVGPGHWFDEDRRHFRIGFGYPPEDEFVRGLEAIEKAARAAMK